MRTRSGRRARGSTLALNLIALAVFALLVAVVYRAARSQAVEAVYFERSAQAQSAAEAGLEDALHSLSLDPSWRSGFADKPFGAGSYSVSLSTDAAPRVVATGRSAPILFFGPAARSVAAVAKIDYATTSVLGGGWGLMTRTFLEVDSLVDGYDPSLNPNPVVFETGADVWSNASVATLAGAVRVRGSAYYFSGTPPAASTVEGSVIRSTYTQTLPSRDGAAYQTVNDNLTGLTPPSVYNAGSKSVNVPNGVVATLKPGHYYFRNVTINGTLNVDTSSGTAEVYLTRSLSTGASCRINNASLLPSRLAVYGVNTGQTQILRCAAPLHAYLQDPSATWSVHQAVYGRIWGDTVVVYADGIVHVAGTARLTPVHAGWAAGTWSAAYARP